MLNHHSTYQELRNTPRISVQSAIHVIITVPSRRESRRVSPNTRSHMHHSAELPSAPHFLHALAYPEGHEVPRWRSPSLALMPEDWEADFEWEEPRDDARGQPRRDAREGAGRGRGDPLTRAQPGRRTWHNFGGC